MNKIKFIFQILALFVLYLIIGCKSAFVKNTPIPYNYYQVMNRVIDESISKDSAVIHGIYYIVDTFTFTTKFDTITECGGLIYGDDKTKPFYYPKLGEETGFNITVPIENQTLFLTNLCSYSMYIDDLILKPCENIELELVYHSGSIRNKAGIVKLEQRK